MGSILTQNGKMKKSSQNGIDVYNFGIPAFLSNTGLKTCPMAGVCATGCYARSGTYRFGNVVNAYEERLKLTQNENFVDLMVAEIRLKYMKSQVKDNKCLIRIHDSGDFYSKDYAMSWIEIIEKCLDVRFYAYTKMIQIFNELSYNGNIPNNFRLIYSFGGKQDHLIDCINHRHSKVFPSETDLLAAGYTDATNDDLVAALGPNNKIGLVYHGQKSYTNTNWAKVK
jgi:hypothetical protein